MMKLTVTRGTDGFVIIEFGYTVFHQIDAWEASVPHLRIGLTDDQAAALAGALADAFAPKKRKPRGKK